jgi:hypothetical protein
MSDAWDGTLSWCNNHVCFSHNSGLFLCTAYLQHAKTSWYNCLFTIWPCSVDSWWTMPFQSKNTAKITLVFDQLILAFFGRGDHLLQWLHLGFNIIPINPRLISCYDVLKKFVFTICIDNQLLTDFNTVLFLIVNQKNAARILHWRDTYEFFQ